MVSCLMIVSWFFDGGLVGSCSKGKELPIRFCSVWRDFGGSWKP